MSFKIEQGFRYQGSHWWKWWLWIDGPEEGLDEIDHVVYILHKTFPDPVRTIDDRASKFRLETSGWGVFTVNVRLVFKTGEEERLKHDLVLRYPDGECRIDTRTA
jgi:transcription initiation factor IIF auxiliary subunit